MEKKYLFICYPQCTTCQKAQKWLNDNRIDYELRNIKEQNPTAAELDAWQSRSNIPVRKFFNTSGLVYKALALKDKLATMSDTEQFSLLETDGMLVKRPLLISDDKVLVGFNVKEWEFLR